jgi:predicted esterase
MANDGEFEANTAYQFDPGCASDSPVLIPLARDGASLRCLIGFCRRIAPEASLLIVDRNRFAAGIDDTTRSGRVGADRLASIIKAAVSKNELSLNPIIVVGETEGADLAASVALAHGPLIGACILIHPKAVTSPAYPGVLDGVHVLLMQNAKEDASATANSELVESLRGAGADVICEQVPGIRSLGSEEASIAHVFIAALFGA